MLTLRAGSRALRRAAALRRGFSTTRAAAAADSADEEKQFITLNFSSPYGPVFEGKEVSFVYVPGEDGEMGVAAEHVPTIAQLKPGVVRVAFTEDEDAQTDDYFITGGFAMVNPDSSMVVSAAEVYKLEDLDASAVEAGLQKYQSLAEQGEEDSVEQIQAAIALETYEAMAAALGVGGEGEA